MSTRSILSILGVLLILAEPALAILPVPAQPGPACATCGMHGKCGAVCCCASVRGPGLCRKPSLYPMGCHRDRDSGTLEAVSGHRWSPTFPSFTPPEGQALYPSFRAALHSDIVQEVPSPPPDQALLP